MRYIKRTSIAIFVAFTIFLNASLSRESSGEAEALDDEADPPDILTISYEVPALSDASKVIAVNVDAREAAREAERQRIKDEEDARIAEVKRLEALEVEREAARERKAKAAATANKPTEPSRSSDYVGQAQAFSATAYTAYCEGCSGITKTGVNLRNSIYHEGKRVIAVDPRRITLGSIVQVTLADGGSFEAIAEDIGSAIQGAIIDVAHETTEQANSFGRQSVEVRIIRKGR